MCGNSSTQFGTNSNLSLVWIPLWEALNSKAACCCSEASLCLVVAAVLPPHPTPKPRLLPEGGASALLFAYLSTVVGDVHDEPAAPAAALAGTEPGFFRREVDLLPHRVLHLELVPRLYTRERCERKSHEYSFKCESSPME